MTARTYVLPAIPISGPASARPVGSGSTQRTKLGMGPLYPLSITYGSKSYLLRYLPMYGFTPQTCPIRWCAHLWGCRWGVRGFYPDLRPSQAVDRRRTLYNIVVHCLYDVHYLIHTHHIRLMELLGGWASPLDPIKRKTKTKTKPFQAKNCKQFPIWLRSLGGLPFFQSNSRHWEGMAPLRGTGSGGFPLIHIA